MELADKVVLVTGGTKGIGAATAIQLAQNGANVAINGRHEDESALETLQSIRSLGRVGELIVGDCAIPEDARRCVDETIQRLGRVDALVHSAGGGISGTILDVAPETWMAAFDIHRHAIYHLCRAAIPSPASKLLPPSLKQVST